MHPGHGHALCDGMLGVTDDDLERMLRPVVPAPSLGLIADELPISVQINIVASLLIPSPPASQANDLVVIPPVAERIVRGMNDDESAAPFYVINECLPRRFGPGGAVVVRDDNVVLGEVGPKALIGP